jgi:hypothetical protein
MLQAQLNPAPKVRKIPYFAGRFAPPRMLRYVFLTTREGSWSSLLRTSCVFDPRFIEYATFVGLLTALVSLLIFDCAGETLSGHLLDGQRLRPRHAERWIYDWALSQSRMQRGAALSPPRIGLCVGERGCARALRILLDLPGLLSYVPRGL